MSVPTNSLCSCHMLPGMLGCVLWDSAAIWSIPLVHGHIETLESTVNFTCNAQLISLSPHNYWVMIKGQGKY